MTAAIIRRDGRILLARRRPGKRHAGLWEFPGGKIERGESAEGCLARELREELGVEVRVGAFVAASLFDYGDGPIELLAYEVTITGGVLRPVDHDALEWVAPERLGSFEVTEADVPIVNALAGPGSPGPG